MVSAPVSPVDPCACPLCGQPNQCAMATQPNDCDVPSACWCVQASFSPALLARVPAAAQRKACICARCVHASLQSESEAGANAMHADAPNAPGPQVKRIH